MQQALERAGIKSNKGWDYAMNALEMASLMQEFKGNGSASNNGSYENGTVITQALPASSSQGSALESTVEHIESADT
jgi:6,7-dimethyl-8-ribityllumazine synthase